VNTTKTKIIVKNKEVVIFLLLVVSKIIKAMTKKEINIFTKDKLQ
jgi:hypothetical protein